MVPRVSFAEAGRMNLLGYFLRARLRAARRPFPGSGRVGVAAAGMAVTVAFEDGGAVLSEGIGTAEAWVEGDLAALLAAATGRGLVMGVLSGRLRPRGRVWRLLPLARLLT